jgi:hypothetical protein
VSAEAQGVALLEGDSGPTEEAEARDDLHVLAHPCREVGVPTVHAGVDDRHADAGAVDDLAADGDGPVEQLVAARRGVGGLGEHLDRRVVLEPFDAGDRGEAAQRVGVAGGQQHVDLRVDADDLDPLGGGRGDRVEVGTALGDDEDGGVAGQLLDGVVDRGGQAADDVVDELAGAADDRGQEPSDAEQGGS